MGLGTSYGWAQQDATMSPPGTQQQTTAGSLPPPTPPQQNAQATMTDSMSTASEQSQGVQAPTPPQPPDAKMRDSGNRGNVPAELGVFMVAADGPGVRVTRVTPDSAAALAGLRVGDFVLAINGQPVEAPHDVVEQIQRLRPGDTVELRVWQNGAEQLVSAMLKEKRPVQVQSQTTYVNPPTTYYEDGGVYYNDGGYRPVVRHYGYYPGSYYDYGYGYGPSYYNRGWGGYGYGYPSRYYGTSRFGYYESPWGSGVRVGGLQFGWR
jgi:hypothetical protein